MSAPDRRGMLDRDEARLSIRRQCALLGVPRSSVYRPKTPANDNDLALMRRLDELFTAWPLFPSDRNRRSQFFSERYDPHWALSVRCWR